MKRKKADKDNYLKIIYLLAAIVIIETVCLIASYRKSEPRNKPEELIAQKQKQEEKNPGPQPLMSFGKIALVLDDWGYSLNNLPALKQINEPLTIAILPKREYSAAIARAVQEFKQEAILHLPLEPKKEKKSHLEPETITVNMPKEKVRAILEADFKSLPGIKGISNHMGSLATENEALMRTIFIELKRHKLYFLDSFTGKTVCKSVAQKEGLPYARRQVFLDNQTDEDYILSQMETLAKIARQSGSAIGIGHDRPKTLSVLLKAIPDFKKRGYQFVFVSQLAR